MLIRTFSKNRKLIIQRRKLIVCAARRVFFQKGYNGATMQDIARECGFTTGAIYYYIGSKEDILHLTVKQSADNSILLEKYNRNLKNLNTTDKLKACITKLFELTYNDGEIQIFYTREIKHFNKADKYYLLNSQIKIVEFFNQLLMEGREKGEFSFEESPTIISHNILMLSNVFVTRRWFLQKQFSLEEYTNAQIDLILKSLVP